MTVRTLHSISNGRGSTDRSRGGFTLVELLTVIGIISLLLLIGAPAAVNIMHQVKVKTAEAVLAQISSALKAYKTDFEAYPPSYPEGGERICRLLTGFAPDSGDDQTPGKGAGFNSDDGKQGFGFRLAPKGPVFGPYFGTEELNTSGSNKPHFVDTFNQSVMYYLYDTATSRFNPNDNSDDPSDINNYARNKEGGFYRTDFLLLTRGADGEWDSPREKDSDDITNFKQK